MSENLPWADLPLLLAVARSGSFLAAGRAAGLSTSTVSRRITQRERALGTVLVERGAEGTRLTEAGARLVEAASKLEHQLGAALRDLPSQGANLSGKIRLTLGDGFVAAGAMALAEFSAAHPGVTVEMHAENRLGDLAHREYDLAIRTVHGGEEPLVYRKLGNFDFGLYAAPSYLKRHGTPAQVGELACHRMIGFSPAMSGADQMLWLAQAGITRFALSVNTFTAMLESARAGLGIAPLPSMAAAGLSRILSNFQPKPVSVYLTAHIDALKQPHIRAFADALTAIIKDELRKAAPQRGAKPARR
jgi:molybdate transport repressor ModE-like protein